ncbi:MULTISPECIES: hypothetical protein [Xanthomonas]|uniref:hypothetical protein n=1 Tax=Xanthomonas TaxID=338 RepID=UPI0011B01DFB|nr:MULTISPECIES: hypothetical protein [Xanthomonas]MEB1941275.1 hypothetical protein [Xanthomonas campestris pv. campestris]UYP76605.1 hypothetical protein OF401_13770 [Xanthomonas campestris pv. campestris]
MSPGLSLANLERILSASHEPGRVTRTVGDSVFYIKLRNGAVFGLPPDALLVKSPKGISRYAGEPFRKLGLINGADVEVYGTKDSANPRVVLLDTESRTSLFKRIFPD